jgi:hypothetical protein
MKSRLLLCALLCLPVMAGAKVYKWVDKDGNVHFTETPPPEEIVEAEEVDTSRSELSESQRQEAIRLKRSREPDTAEAASSDDAAMKERQKAIEAQLEKDYQAKRLKACNSAKVNLQMMQSGGRVYEENASGERIPVDESARAERIEYYQGKVKQYCGPEQR